MLINIFQYIHILFKVLAVIITKPVSITYFGYTVTASFGQASVMLTIGQLVAAFEKVTLNQPGVIQFDNVTITVGKAAV